MQFIEEDMEPMFISGIWSQTYTCLNLRTVATLELLLDGDCLLLQQALDDIQQVLLSGGLLYKSDTLLFAILQEMHHLLFTN